MKLKGLLLDLDGTLYEGEDPVPGARESLVRLKAAGLSLRYVTNTTRKPRSMVYEQLDSLGFDVEETEIVTPALTAARLIEDRTCFPLVDDSLLEDLGEISLTESSPDYVLIGDLGEGFTYERLNAAFRYLMEGARLVALQKNRYWSIGGELSLDAGPFVAALEYAGGKTATVVGKPEESFFRLVLDDMELKPGEAGMVGDDPEADVAGALAAGLAGFQVRTGKYRPDALIEGGTILDSVSDLPAALGI